MCPTIVVVVEEADGVRALGASSIPAPVFLVPAVAAALLLLLGSGRTSLWELKELLRRLLLLLREEGDLLLQSLHAGRHLANRLYRRRELVCLLLALLELMACCHVCLLVCLHRARQVG
jgi:hypothetical protein